MTKNYNTNNEIEKFNNSIIADHFQEWSKKIASSLWDKAKDQDIEEAVEVAILKVMGLHDRYHLSKPLPRMCEGQLYVTIRNQTEWILGHSREFGSRFEEYVELTSADDDSTCKPTKLDEDQLSHHGHDKKDGFQILVASIKKVLRQRRFKEYCIKGFLLSKVFGYSAKEVVRMLPAFVSENNFNKLVCLMKQALVEDAYRPDGCLAEFRPAA